MSDDTECCAEHHATLRRLVANVCCTDWCAGDLGHGMECIAEILGFVISLINSVGETPHHELNVFGLELMNAALNAGGKG